MSSDGTISRFELYLVLVKNLAHLFSMKSNEHIQGSPSCHISNSPAPRSRFVETLILKSVRNARKDSLRFPFFVLHDKQFL